MKWGKTHWLRAAALGAAASAVFFTGCPKPKVISKALPIGRKEKKIGVTMMGDENANHGSPVKLDILLVSDKELVKKLQEMSAFDWFKKRSQITRSQSKKGALWVSSWELVPGQVIRLEDVRVPPQVETAIVFANYPKDEDDPDDYRAVLDPRKDVRITLGVSKFEVSQ
ncbi:MAG TPA: hypothetical protein VF736_14750 [Pyrinomonadaceae bacterium]|jgi:hypothetical protein